MRQSMFPKHEQSCSTALVLAGFLLAACHGSSDNPSGVATSQNAAGTCADPIVMDGTATLSGQTTKDAKDAISGDDPTCVGYATHGAELVYKITVPAKDKTKLHIAVSPTDTLAADAFDPVVYATEGCGAQPTCSAGQDTHGGGGPESIEYTNASGQDKVLYVVVDGYDFQPSGGSYSLAAELATP